MTRDRIMQMVGQMPVVFGIPNDGEKIYRYSKQTNANTVIYKVPVLTLFLLYNYYLMGAATGPGEGGLRVFNPLGDFQNHIDVADFLGAGHIHEAGQFTPPMVFEAGESIKVYSGAAAVSITAGIFGYSFNVKKS